MLHVGRKATNANFILVVIGLTFGEHIVADMYFNLLKILMAQ
jgi:hypothetical protein